CLFPRSRAHRHLHSFPTRRSSDLTTTSTPSPISSAIWSTHSPRAATSNPFPSLVSKALPILITRRRAFRSWRRSLMVAVLSLQIVTRGRRPLQRRNRRRQSRHLHRFHGRRGGPCDLPRSWHGPLHPSGDGGPLPARRSPGSRLRLPPALQSSA